MTSPRPLALLLVAALAPAPAPAEPETKPPASSMSSRPAGSMSARRAPSGTEPDRDADGATLVEGLRFALPEAWESVTPRSPMRKAQAKIPGPAGDATLTVFHFGPGGGGGVEANMARWEGQMIPDEGAAPERKQLEGSGTTVHLTALDGTLKPSRMSGIPEPVPGSRLMGAVVEGEGGPWFFKVTGPAMTVRLAMPDFVEMLASSRVD